jgi:hypothetical protein
MALGSLPAAIDVLPEPPEEPADALGELLPEPVLPEVPELPEVPAEALGELLPELPLALVLPEVPALVPVEPDGPALVPVEPDVPALVPLPEVWAMATPRLSAAARAMRVLFNMRGFSLGKYDRPDGQPLSQRAAE